MSVYIAMKNVLVPLLETVITLRISDQLLKFSHEDGMTLEIRDECVHRNEECPGATLRNSNHT